jgi:vacuolar protein sorting-associated protein 16
MLSKPVFDTSDLRYMKIGPEGVIERLMNRREHFLAVQICNYLDLPAERVYTNWACLKVVLCPEKH